MSAAQAPVPTVAGERDSRGCRRRGSGRLILLSLLVPALAFAATLPPWVTAQVDTVLAQRQDIDVPGTTAAPAVSALALVALAGVLTVRIAGPVLRAVICAVIALAGVGMALTAVSVPLDPENAARTSVGQRTGAVGAGGDYAVHPWPWVCLVLAVGIVVMAVTLWRASRTWRSAGRRFERPGQRAAAAQETTPSAEQAPHARDIDAWDRLSRGEDPTA
ncbi:Trp biosynthesis-associated membrane protein [Rothia kristinae]|uniref:Trp biosynthesis-associated membrane protein n=1 Tax=Rothia kristinae TaxID=37923 RepID=UPI0022E5C085|nr:Trp biosynthesis-associated membrane protein [Rothia kristinae]